MKKFSWRRFAYFLFAFPLLSVVWWIALTAALNREDWFILIGPVGVTMLAALLNGVHPRD